mmetsp:Transcript_13044/g.9437  ORF Transcript_13044/g.9437 Transcript_13044/m.9437 type:complete len:92 (+) Transcript_13044:273-548(+)
MCDFARRESCPLSSKEYILDLLGSSSLNEPQPELLSMLVSWLKDVKANTEERGSKQWEQSRRLFQKALGVLERLGLGAAAIKSSKIGRAVN